MIAIFQKKVYIRVLLCCQLLMLVLMGQSQVTVTGPICVVPGTTYQYVLSGKWETKSWMRVCVSGGIINQGNSCTDSAVRSSVFITWTDTANLQLSIQSSSGSLFLRPAATKDLQGGMIDDSDKMQVADTGSRTYLIRCEGARGGSCVPQYLYQWQRSEDGLHWQNIEGGIDRNLSFTGTIKVNTFFRRVTNESASGMTAYSDCALLEVQF